MGVYTIRLKSNLEPSKKYALAPNAAGVALSGN